MGKKINSTALSEPQNKQIHSKMNQDQKESSIIEESANLQNPQVKKLDRDYRDITITFKNKLFEKLQENIEYHVKRSQFQKADLVKDCKKKLQSCCGKFNLKKRVGKKTNRCKYTFGGKVQQNNINKKSKSMHFRFWCSLKTYYEQFIKKGVMFNFDKQQRVRLMLDIIQFQNKALIFQKIEIKNYNHIQKIQIIKKENCPSFPYLKPTQYRQKLKNKIIESLKELQTQEQLRQSLLDCQSFSYDQIIKDSPNKCYSQTKTSLLSLQLNKGFEEVTDQYKYLNEEINFMSQESINWFQYDNLTIEDTKKISQFIISPSFQSKTSIKMQKFEDFTKSPPNRPLDQF